MNDDPLIAFSWYLSGRVFCVRALGGEVLADLEAAFTATPIDGGRIERAEAKMWFWVLGAYEIVRTMSQAKGCFSPGVSDRLGTLKRELADARMPAAKMERTGKKVAVNSDRSPAEWDIAGRDLLIGDPRGSVISSHGLIVRFNEIMTSIRSTDVIKSHEASYDKEA